MDRLLCLFMYYKSVRLVDQLDGRVPSVRVHRDLSCFWSPIGVVLWTQSSLDKSPDMAQHMWWSPYNPTNEPDKCSVTS